MIRRKRSAPLITTASLAGSLLAGSLLACAVPALAQTTATSARVERAPTSITVDAFMARVAAHHPVIRQARLGVDHAREEQRVARGAFDPTVAASWDRKTFGTVAYYDYVTAALSIPTPVGVDVKLGFERATGQYISPDRRTPRAGLVTAGLSVPFGQRMLTDERRTAVVVARSLRDGAIADRDGTINRVLLQATRDFARWFESVRRERISADGVALAEFRLAAVRRRVANGETPALDTVEARMEAERRRVQQIEAVQAAYAARLTAEANLWDARGLPDSLPTGTTPSAVLLPSAAPGTVAAAGAPLRPDVAALTAAAVRLHPDVQRADARIDQAAAQRRLAAQQRLPSITAELGTLGLPDDGLPHTPSTDDLKAGATLRTPLLLLRERGRANGAAIREEQQRVDRDRARRDVAVVVRTAVAEVDAVVQAAALQRSVVTYARTLVRGEQLRFDAGESTLFLVNARERALLDEDQRLASLEARALVVLGELAAATGAWLTAPRAAPP